MSESKESTLELKEISFPRAGCPRCLFYGSFDDVSHHMFRFNHLYQGYGTYPMHIPDLPTLMAMGYESFPACEDCREHIIKAHYGGNWIGFQGALPFCTNCLHLQALIEKASIMEATE